VVADLSQEEIDFSTYSHGILVFVYPFVYPHPSSLASRHTQEEYYDKHGE
jgi:hypothetical protein